MQLPQHLQDLIEEQFGPDPQEPETLEEIHYNQGFQDAVESMTLAAFCAGVNNEILINMILTTADALANNT